jgi:hypothetical protein
MRPARRFALQVLLTWVPEGATTAQVPVFSKRG